MVLIIGDLGGASEMAVRADKVYPVRPHAYPPRVLGDRGIWRDGTAGATGRSAPPGTVVISFQTEPQLGLGGCDAGAML
jgi:hypothetical protein